MSLAMHRKSPNRAREVRERAWAEVERALGIGTICGRCGATLKTMADKCDANLDERCPGTLAIDRVRVAAAKIAGAG